jgi:hypothetical protein
MKEVFYSAKWWSILVFEKYEYRNNIRQFRLIVYNINIALVYNIAAPN